MDNITHTLVGTLIALPFLEREKRPLLRRGILLASIIANNLPDADFLYASFLSHPFGILLHHRGHTHTILGALACGIFVWLLVSSCLKLLGERPSKKYHVQLLMLSIIGGVVHIGLDWMNTYGVHPFWPFSNRWVYGDTLFIIEPILWITLSLGIIFSRVSDRMVRGIAVVPPFLGLGLIVFSKMVPDVVIIAELLFFLVFLLISHRYHQRVQGWLWQTLSVLVVLCFSLCGDLAYAQLISLSGGREKPLVSFVQPSPANPLCWSSWEVRREGEDLVYEKDIISLINSRGLFECKDYLFEGPPINAAKISPRVTQLQINRLPVKELASYAENCRWRAFLQFSRLPSVTECKEHQRCTMDLRFVRGDLKNFSVQELAGDCPTFLPPWEAPGLSLIENFYHQVP